MAKEVRDSIDEKEEEKFVAPKADLSNFSVYDSEDEAESAKGHFIEEDPYVPGLQSETKWYYFPNSLLSQNTKYWW